MFYVLDASAILNNPRFSFDEKHRYACTLEVLKELKIVETKTLAENALKQKLLRVYRPRHKYQKNAAKIVIKKGFTRLSEADISVIALAMQFKGEKRKFSVLTDDYSIQNFLEILSIPFQPIIQGRIEHPIAFVKYCPVCKREFRNANALKECPYCGTELETRRIVERQKNSKKKGYTG